MSVSNKDNECFPQFKIDNRFIHSKVSGNVVNKVLG